MIDLFALQFVGLEFCSNIYFLYCLIDWYICKCSFWQKVKFLWIEIFFFRVFDLERDGSVYDGGLLVLKDWSRYKKSFKTSKIFNWDLYVKLWIPGGSGKPHIA